jgi:hypothetical protein
MNEIDYVAKCPRIVGRGERDVKEADAKLLETRSRAG